MAEDDEIEYRNAEDYRKERLEKQGNLVKTAEKYQNKAEVDEVLEGVEEVDAPKVRYVTKRGRQVREIAKKADVFVGKVGGFAGGFAGSVGQLGKAAAKGSKPYRKKYAKQHGNYFNFLMGVPTKKSKQKTKKTTRKSSWKPVDFGSFSVWNPDKKL